MVMMASAAQPIKRFTIFPQHHIHFVGRGECGHCAINGGKAYRTSGILKRIMDFLSTDEAFVIAQNINHEIALFGSASK